MNPTTLPATADEFITAVEAIDDQYDTLWLSDRAFEPDHDLAAIERRLWSLVRLEEALCYVSQWADELELDATCEALFRSRERTWRAMRAVRRRRHALMREVNR